VGGPKDREVGWAKRVGYDLMVGVCNRGARGQPAGMGALEATALCEGAGAAKAAVGWIVGQTMAGERPGAPAEYLIPHCFESGLLVLTLQ
jgi:hypothetical protein